MPELGTNWLFPEGALVLSTNKNCNFSNPFYSSECIKQNELQLHLNTELHQLRLINFTSCLLVCFTMSFLVDGILMLPKQHNLNKQDKGCQLCLEKSWLYGDGA